MNRFADILKTEILKGLPGTEVQWQMASSDRMLKDFPRIPGQNAQEAAVLILLYPFKDSVSTVFMQRHDYKGVHGGQISFPGGKKEPSDKDLIHTAIREACEETGAEMKDLIIINTLSPLFIPVSNIIVTPVVGWLEDKPVFNHKPDEVVFLFDADIRRLMDPLIIRVKPFEIRGEMIDVKYFDYEGNVIWGATAMILHELLTIIKNSEIKSFWD